MSIELSTCYYDILDIIYGASHGPSKNPLSPTCPWTGLAARLRSSRTAWLSGQQPLDAASAEMVMERQPHHPEGKARKLSDSSRCDPRDHLTASVPGRGCAEPLGSWHPNLMSSPVESMLACPYRQSARESTEASPPFAPPFFPRATMDAYHP